jgi:N-acetylneuraminic acid mutarotase
MPDEIASRAGRSLHWSLRFAVLLIMLLGLNQGTAMAQPRLNSKLKPAWEKLPSIPDPEGFAGAYAGVSHGALILAGGANITSNRWADNFVKTWHEGVYVLEVPSGKWVKSGKLPHPIGYGVSVTAGEEIVCLGGSDSQRHYAEVFRLEYSPAGIVTTPLPDLPRACANSCGALVGQTIYLAGGIETPSSTVALNTFWALDLSRKPLRWEHLPPWPGPERMLGVAGSFGGSFYLFSGTKLHAGPDGKPAREFLKDAYRFSPAKGWERLPDLPRAAVAAPSPAPVAATSLLVISGDDGLKVDFKPVTEHPGFPRDVLAFDAETKTWSVIGQAPFSRATTPTVEWRGKLVVPNGEERPRVRSPEVWAVEFKAD